MQRCLLDLCWERTGADLKRWLLAFVVLLAILAGPVWSAQWDIAPTASLRQTYTDNIGLDPEGLAQSDWVTQLIPAISIAGVGAGAQFILRYAPEITYYLDNEDESQVFHRGNALGTAELLKDLFYVDAGGGVDQYNVSLGGPLTFNNIYLTGNRATVETFFASPYLLYEFGSSAQAEVRFTYSVWNSDDQPDFNNVADRIDLGLRSGPSFKILQWDLEYTKSDIDYENRSDFDLEVFLATVRRPVTASTSLLAQAGDETYARSIEGEPTGESAGGTRWGVGIDWAPTSRTRLTVAAGDRFFGDAYFLDLVHRTRRFSLQGGFTQDVTTTRTEFFVPGFGRQGGYLEPLYSNRISDTERRRREVQSVISERGIQTATVAPVNFFSSDPFLQERWYVSAAMQGIRNVIVATVFGDDRKRLPGFVYDTGALAAADTIDQLGTSIAWSFSVSARTYLNLDAAYNRNEFPDTGREDDLTRFRIGLTRRFQPRFLGDIYFEGQENESSVSTNNFSENAVVGELRIEF